MRDQVDIRALDAASGKPEVPIGYQHSLPLSARISLQLSELLVIASELDVLLGSEEAAAFSWLTPEVEQVVERTTALLDKLSS